MATTVQEVRKTFALALPIILGLVGTMAMAWIDAAMVGRGLGTTELAALAFAASVGNLFLIAGFGLAQAVQVRIAQAFGAARREDYADILRHGLVITAGFGLFMTAAFNLLHEPLATFAVTVMRQPEAAVEAGMPYLRIYASSFVFALMHGAIGGFCEAQNRPWTPLLLRLIALGLNAFLNWVLIFGNLGAPALGLTGAAVATALAHGFFLVTLTLTVIASPRFPVGREILALHRLNLWRLKSLLAIGIPSSLQIFVEVAAFQIAAFLAGVLGAVPLAAHQIALNFAAMTFMVPLAISFALSIRVGQAAGAGDRPAIRRIAFGNLAFIGLLMIVTATAYILLRGALPYAFTDDPEVATLAASLLILVALFQFFDGTQVAAMGCLRGLTDVRIPTALILGCYWGISLPTGWWLAFREDMGVFGIWTGLTAGLVLAALLLNARFLAVTREGRPLPSAEGSSPETA